VARADRVAQDRAAQDRVDPAAARVDLAGLARVVRLGLGIRVNQAAGMAATGREVTSRVVPEDTNLADLAVTDLVDLVDLVDLENRVGLGDPAVRASPVVLADMILEGPEDLGIQARAEPCMTAQEPKGRMEVRVLSQDRVRLALTPTAPDRARPGRMPALPARMPAHLHRMPADLDRTRPAEPARRVEVTRRVAVTLRVAAILAVAAAAILPAERALTGNTAMVLASRSGARRVTDRERLCAQAFQGDLGG
jgi:hypothetical protein